MKAPFKYFVKVAKAYQENDDWYVEGIASGTLEDRDEERMSEDVLVTFAKSIPLPLTNSHPRPGDVLGKLGEVVDAEILDDGASSLYIKAKLDQSNPAAAYAYKQIQEGARMAFSIEGDAPITRPVFSEKLGRIINEFIQVIPRAISLTTEPSYTPSFAMAVAKSYNNLIIKTPNMDEKETQVTETTETVPTETTTETTPTVVEEVTQPTEATSEEVVEETKSMEALEEVAKSAKKAMPESKETPSDEPDADADDKTQKSSGEDLMKMVKAMCEKMDAMMSRMDNAEKSTKKNFNTVATVLKSVHDEMEVIKDLPLQKRSVVAKSIEQRAEQPKTAQEAIKGFLSDII